MEIRDDRNSDSPQEPGVHERGEVQPPSPVRVLGDLLKERFGGHPPGSAEGKQGVLEITGLPGMGEGVLCLPAADLLKRDIEIPLEEYDFLEGWRALYHRPSETVLLAVDEVGWRLQRERLLPYEGSFGRRQGESDEPILRIKYAWRADSPPLEFELLRRTEAGHAAALGGSYPSLRAARRDTYRLLAYKVLGAMVWEEQEGDVPLDHWRIHPIAAPELDAFGHDLEQVCRTVAFELEYNTGHHLRGERMVDTGTGAREDRPPDEQMTLQRGAELAMMHKEYPGEPFEYISAAQQSLFPPAKFLCYYQVLEYYYDRCLVKELGRAVREMVMRPGFRPDSEDFVEQAVTMVRKAQMGSRDLPKLQNVLTSLVARQPIEQVVHRHPHLKEPTELAEDVSLPAIDTEGDSGFYDSVSRRIYATRRCVVHSNPDFDEGTKVPLIPTPTNIAALAGEIPLVRAVAYEVMIGVASGRLE